MVLVPRLFKNIFGTAVIVTMCLLIGSTFTMTAFAASPGDVGIWSGTTPLPIGLAYTNSVIYNGYVYKIGGSTGVEINTVYSAPLNSNGTVGAWAATTPLPQNLSNSTSVVYNGYVYVMGGTSDSFVVNTVYSAPLNLNGTIGAWATSANTLPQTLNATTSIVYNDYVYVMGGFNGIPLDTVYSAPVNNGTVGTWAISPNTLPQGLQFASAINYNGYAYIIGGLSYSDIVYSAPLGANGTIGAWTASPNTLPQALFGHTTVSYNGYAYVMGGYASGVESDAVYSAPLGANGTIGAWATSPNSLPQALWAASAVTANGFVYNIGGTRNYEFFSDVYYAQLTDYLPPASPSQPSQPTAVAAPNTGLEPTSYIPAAITIVAGLSLIFVTRRLYS